MTYRYRTRGSDLSSQGTRPYTSLGQYMGARVKVSMSKAHICNELARLSGPQAHSPDAATSFPWLTLVLGSEALEPELRLPVDAECLAEWVKNQLTAVNITDQWGLNLTVDFVRALYQTRMEDQGPRQGDSQAQNEPTYQRWHLALFHATALLNSVYFFTKVAHRIPINRWDDDILYRDRPVQATRTLEARWASLTRAFNMLSTELRAAITNPSESGRIDRDAYLQRLNFINRLVTAIRDDCNSADRPGILTSNAHALTEVAWFYIVKSLVKDSDAYLNWSEMLVSIGLTPRRFNEKDAREAFQVRPRPRYSDLEEASKVISTELRGITIQRAREYTQVAKPDPSGADDESKPAEAYAAYANLLVAEANLRHRRRQSSRLETRDAVFNSVKDEDESDDTKPVLFRVPGVVADTPTDTMPVPDAHARDNTAATDSNAGANVPPVAVAFVTTFDLEMEMALCRHHPEVPFVVALPVNVALQTGDEAIERAASLWLGYVVGPVDPKLLASRGDDREMGQYTDQEAEQYAADTFAREPFAEQPPAIFSQVAEPDIRRWFVLDEDEDRSDTAKSLLRIRSPLVRKLEEAGPLPFIVRLSGSPLVKLPRIEALARRAGKSALASLSEEIQEVVYSSDATDVDSWDEAARAAASIRARDNKTEMNGYRRHLEHGLLLEEHHALQLSFPEVSGNSRRALPRELTGKKGAKYWRFWTLLGVQTSDDAIRYRLIAQIIGGQLKRAEVYEGTEYAQGGVALNRAGTLTSRAHELLRWSDFDIVEVEAPEATEELLHYVQHLVKANTLADGTLEPRDSQAIQWKRGSCSIETKWQGNR